MNSAVPGRVIYRSLYKAKEPSVEKAALRVG